ncbi:MAG: hypothetical protein AAF960_18720 [Bacteroidota bacterium]
MLNLFGKANGTIRITVSVNRKLSFYKRKLTNSGLPKEWHLSGKATCLFSHLTLFIGKDTYFYKIVQQIDCLSSPFT